MNGRPALREHIAIEAITYELFHCFCIKEVDCFELLNTEQEVLLEFTPLVSKNLSKFCLSIFVLFHHTTEIYKLLLVLRSQIRHQSSLEVGRLD